MQTRTVVYADFNCPFCYALDVRLGELPDAERLALEWRPIVHAPGVSSACMPAAEHAELASEVFTVRHRAPEVTIRLPPYRPSSAAATEAYALVAARDAAGAERFRHAIYVALWVDGVDISDPARLSELAEEAGVTVPPPFPDALSNLVAWQREWEQGPFDRRIPSLRTGDDRTLLGLSAPEDISAFLAGRTPPLQGSAVCHFVPRQALLVVGAPAPIWPLLAGFTEQCDVRVAESAEQALQQMEVEPPDLLVVHAEISSGIWSGMARALADRAHELELPMVVVDAVPTDARARACGERGAVEYFDASVAPDTFRSRVDLHLAGRKRALSLRHSGRVDGFTRLPTRDEFDRLLALQWQRACRSKLPLSILRVELDGFEAISRASSARAADGILVTVASALEGALPGDTLARFDRQGFVAILPNTGEHALSALASACVAEVRDLAIPDPAAADRTQVSVTVGGSTAVATPAGDPLQLLDRAEQALARAAAAGRGAARVEPRAPGS